FDVPMEKVAELARGLSWYKMSKLAYSPMGLANGEVIGEFIDKLIGKDARIEDAKIPLAIVATDIETGGKVVFRAGNVAKAVMASTSIPGLFAPVSHEGALLVDGGLVENLPVTELASLGADVTIGVNLARWRMFPHPKSVIGVMVNSMDIMVHQQSVMHGKEADLVIEPHLEAFTSSDWDKTDALINEGYRVTTKMLPSIRALAEQRRATEKTKKHIPWYKRVWRSIYRQKK
ncbi:MAG: patatin-like phospholipase family protein, partial [Candidatus Pacebacteria bacterium]|nr:patatin-like phospholipase family protein [Candidatus Paceibacterota bacterium]